MADGRPLPDHTVRISRRAKRVRLIVTARDGLVVVVPKGSKADVAAIVASKREWAERALRRVAERRSELTGPVDGLLPDTVDLPGVATKLPVEYRHSMSERVSAREHGALLVLTGDVEDAEKCLAALRRWLHRAASEQLPPLVEALAKRHGLLPSRIRIGGARTRWGSCSAQGTITLCRNAVFLPEHLLDALVLHELAHLRVLDHSTRFWAFLSEMDVHAIAHRKELRDAEKHVPAWAYL